MPVTGQLTGSIGPIMMVVTIIIAVIISVISLWSFFSDVPSSCQGDGHCGGSRKRRRINTRLRRFMKNLFR